MSNIIFNNGRLKAFLLRSRTRQERVCPFSPLLFNIIMEVLLRKSRQVKEKNKYPNWKEGCKIVSVCR